MGERERRFHPIPFTAPMVRALLDGRKTQTRRIITPRAGLSLFDGTWSDSYVLDPGNKDWRARDVRYAVGDLLWVREPWWAEMHFDVLPGRELPEDAPVYYQTKPAPGCAGRYRHARFMPRRFSRLTLEVTDVRVQRLQDISEADARAEGAKEDYPGRPYWSGFIGLWESINGPGAWEANPWVVALTFTVHHYNVDAMPPEIAALSQATKDDSHER